MTTLFTNRSVMVFSPPAGTVGCSSMETVCSLGFHLCVDSNEKSFSS